MISVGLPKRLEGDQRVNDPKGPSSDGDPGWDRVDPRGDITIFGIPFWNPSYSEFDLWWKQTLASQDRKGKCVVGANAHTLNNVWLNPEFRLAVEHAQVRVNDGIGFRLAALMRGSRIRYNFNGTDLIPRLFSELSKPIRVFLYGAAEDVNAIVEKRLTEEFPMIQVVGRINGFVDPKSEVVPAIRDSNADLVLVALGHPRQELFAMRYGQELNVKIVYPVGGLFDFLSGSKPRAPELIRRLSLEWAYRLAVEPKRMFARYVIGNPAFLARSFATIISDRRIMKGSSRKVPV